MITFKEIEPGLVQDKEMKQINEIVTAGFGHGNPGVMKDDTSRHVRGSESLNVALDGDIIVAVGMYRDVFGDRALELSGHVVVPGYQRRGIGLDLLNHRLQALQPEFLTAFTRNPAILKMMAKAATKLYPLQQDEALHQIAVEYGGEEVILLDGVAYQLDRYGDEGLYGSFDPSLRTYGTTSATLQDRFPGLNKMSAALVVVASVGERL